MLMSGVIQLIPIHGFWYFQITKAPPETKRNEELMKLFIKTNIYSINKNSIIYKKLKNTPVIKLKSRKIPWIKARKLTQSQFCSSDK
jgi:hypothetical protein